MALKPATGSVRTKATGPIICVRYTDGTMSRHEALEAKFGCLLAGAVKLELAGDMAGALGLLEGFRAAHADSATQDWVDNAVAFQQGMILGHFGHLDRCLEKHRTTKIDPSDRAFYLLNLSCIAEALDRLERPDEAFRELVRGIQAVEGKPDISDLGVLDLTFRLASQTDRPVGQEVLRLAIAVLQLRGIAAPDSHARDDEAVGHSVHSTLAEMRVRR